MMASTRMRGLSDAKGSWNTACTERRYSRIPSPARPSIPRPSNRRPPPVGSSSRSTSLAVVVLPQPDSPTRPRVWPRPTEKFTPSTARTTPIVLAKTPRFTGKCLVRLRASRIGVFR